MRFFVLVFLVLLVGFVVLGFFSNPNQNSHAGKTFRATWAHTGSL